MRNIYLNKHNAIWLTVELIVLWALASPPIAKPWYDSLLFQPWLSYGSPEIQSIGGIPKQVFTIPTKTGTQINAWYFKVDGAQKTVLISHGNGGTSAGRKELIEALLPYKVSVLIYDYAGYGESTGKSSLDEILEDGQAVYDNAVTNLKIDPRSIVLAGESLGSAPSCEIAKGNTCNSVVLLAPFSSLLKLAKTKCPWLYLYPNSWFPYRDLDNRKALSKVTRPVLIIVGADDMTIPESESKQLNEACKSSTMLKIPERGHIVYYPPTPEFQNAIKTFLDGK